MLTGFGKWYSSEGIPPLAPFANYAGIDTQPTQNVTFPSFNKFHFLFECRCVCSFPQPSNYSLTGHPHEDRTAGVCQGTNGECGEQDPGRLSERKPIGDLLELTLSPEE